MGEIADMMLEGNMCQCCGELMDGNGYAQVCPGCEVGEQNEETPMQIKTKKSKAIKKWFKILSVEELRYEVSLAISKMNKNQLREACLQSPSLKNAAYKQLEG